MAVLAFCQEQDARGSPRLQGRPAWPAEDEAEIGARPPTKASRPKVNRHTMQLTIGLVFMLNDVTILPHDHLRILVRGTAENTTRNYAYLRRARERRPVDATGAHLESVHGIGGFWRRGECVRRRRERQPWRAAR